MDGYLIASLLMAGTAPGQGPAADPNAEIMMLANAYDRCMTTYAVKLLESGLGDDALYTVSSTLCRDIDGEMRRKVEAGLPPADAKELLARFDADPKGRYAKMLQAVRAGRAARAR